MTETHCFIDNIDIHVEGTCRILLVYGSLVSGDSTMKNVTVEKLLRTCQLIGLERTLQFKLCN